jgi:ABC-type nitrate/sulfonate/bicarbonate transport system substrate-binding protein
VSKIRILVLWFAAVLIPAIGWSADRVNISHSAVSGSQAVLFVTRDAGFFKKYDLDLQILFVAGAPPNIAALVSGDIDLTISPGRRRCASNLEGADTVVLMTFINTMEHTLSLAPTSRSRLISKAKFGIARPARPMITAFGWRSKMGNGRGQGPDVPVRRHAACAIRRSAVGHGGWHSSTPPFTGLSPGKPD